MRRMLLRRSAARVLTAYAAGTMTRAQVDLAHGLLPRDIWLTAIFESMSDTYGFTTGQLYQLVVDMPHGTALAAERYLKAHPTTFEDDTNFDKSRFYVLTVGLSNVESAYWRHPNFMTSQISAMRGQAYRMLHLGRLSCLTGEVPAWDDDEAWYAFVVEAMLYEWATASATYSSGDYQYLTQIDIGSFLTAFNQVYRVRTKLMREVFFPQVLSADERQQIRQLPDSLVEALYGGVMMTAPHRFAQSLTASADPLSRQRISRASHDVLRDDRAEMVPFKDLPAAVI